MTENEAINELLDYVGDAFKTTISVESVTLAREALEEIQQYRAIGTVEELQALKEKNEPKKPTPIDYEKYIDVVQNAKFLRGACWCPNCKHTVRSGAYCDDCGQALDWHPIEI